MTIKFQRTAAVAVLLLASTGVALGGDDKASTTGYAAFSVDVDQEDSRYVDGLLGFTLDSGWAELRVGRLTAESDGSELDATTAALAAGYKVGPVDLGASYAYREDSDSLEQHDFTGDITYLGSTGSIGLDLFLRSAEYETGASIERRRRDPSAITITESIEGRGIGLHGDLYVSQRLVLFAFTMAYDYDESSDLPAGTTRWERISVSGITRDDIWLQDTVNIGATYEFAPLKITADLTRDTTLYTDERILTGSLLASIPLSERWIVSPWIGYSDAELSGTTASGGVEVSVNW